MLNVLHKNVIFARPNLIVLLMWTKRQNKKGEGVFSQILVISLKTQQTCVEYHYDCSSCHKNL